MILSTKHISKLDIYFCLWALYYLQGVLYESGSLLSQALLGILFVWSVLCFFKEYNNTSCLYFKGATIFLFMLVAYSVFGFLIPNGINNESASPFIYFKSSVISFIPIWGFYVLSKETKISEERLVFYISILLVSAFYNYYYLFSQLAAKRNAGDDFEITNNTGYLFLQIAPLLFLLKKKVLLRLFFMIIIIGFIISSMKRGAILIGSVVLLIFIYDLFVVIEKKSIKFLILMFVIASIIAIYSYIQFLYDSSPYFRLRIEQTQEGDSSYRDENFSKIIIYWLRDSSVTEFFIGGGPNSSVKITNGYLAHNDWFELLANQGLLGVFVYITYWVYFVRQWFQINKQLVAKTAFAVLIIVLFMKSLFSMSYNAMSPALQLALSICLCNANLKLNNK